MKTIAIIGGGITGLAAAFHAQSTMPSAKIVLLESSDRLGGVLQSERVDGYLIEHSADMFTTEPPAAVELCQRLGRTAELIQTIPTLDRAFVATRRSIEPVPRGFSLMVANDLNAIAQTHLLDDQAKQRFFEEPNVPARNWDSDESLESFAVRRYGQAAFDLLIQPLVGGIYTADPARLSMQAALIRFVKMEQQHGSLTRAAESGKSDSIERLASGARYGLFRTPENGMGQLVDWIVAALSKTELRTACEVNSISQSGRGWSIAFQGKKKQEHLTVDGVLLATSATVSARILTSVDESLAQQLANIESASSAIVVLGFDESQVQSKFDGYGIVVPSVLGRPVIATSFSSNKFAERAPRGKMLTRSFIGGALRGEWVERSDDELIHVATDELDQTVGFSGNIEFAHIFRWRQSMPQYHLGHLDRVAQIESFTTKYEGLELAGNSYHGVGIPACIQSGIESIDRLVKYFAVP